MGLPERRPERRQIQRTQRLGGRPNTQFGRRWPRGTLRPAGTCCLVADGLSSASYRLRGRYHWLKYVGLRFGRSCPGATSYGFSYAEYGFHYGPIDTAISLQNKAAEKFAEYAAAAGPQHNVIYTGFSLGAVVFTIGLAEFLRRSAGESAGPAPGPASSLVLVQPAFAFSPSFRCEAERMRAAGEPFDAPLAELFFAPREIKQLIVDSLRAILDQGVRVFLLYWPGERFVPIEADLERQLHELGVVIRRVNLRKLVANPDAAHQHGAVYNQPTMLRHLGRIFSQIHTVGDHE